MPDEPQTPADPDPGMVPYLLVDRLAYSDEWPTVAAADGTGKALRRIAFEGLGDQETAWLAEVPSPGTVSTESGDVDGDQLSDAWELSHCLNPKDASDAVQDPDRDGASNRAEYFAQTDPGDPMDVLRWLEAGFDAGKPRLRFIGKAGVKYQVQSADDLGSPQWKQVTSVPAADEARIVDVTETAALGAARYYRVTVVTGP